MKASVPPEWKTKAPRLAALAAWINEKTTLFAEIEKGYCNTDRKVGRLRIPGQGRTGNRIKVFVCEDHKWELIRKPFHYMYADRYKDERKYPLGPLLDHNAAETYRSNDEVVRWLATYLEENPKALKTACPK